MGETLLFYVEWADTGLLKFPSQQRPGGSDEISLVDVRRGMSQAAGQGP